jgi:hypothetical protein
MAGDSWFTKTLKALTPGSKAPAVEPKAPGPGQPPAEDMPSPKGVPTATTKGRPPFGFTGG